MNEKRVCIYNINILGDLYLSMKINMTIIFEEKQLTSSTRKRIENVKSNPDVSIKHKKINASFKRILLRTSSLLGVLTCSIQTYTIVDVLCVNDLQCTVTVLLLHMLLVSS